MSDDGLRPCWQPHLKSEVRTGFSHWLRVGPFHLQERDRLQARQQQLAALVRPERRPKWPSGPFLDELPLSVHHWVASE